MKTQFEKIYVLSLITNHSRQNFIKQQFDELSIEFEFLYGPTFYNIINDSKNNKIEYPNVRPWEAYGTGRSFGCTLAHYSAVQFAYELGYNNVLIIEDDICFLKNKQLIEYYLNNIPKDADFISWDPRFGWDPQYNEFFNIIKYDLDKLLNKQVNNNFIAIDNYWHSLCGGMMYGLMNRETMEIYLDNQNKKFTISDKVKNIFETSYTSTVKRYISTHCICLGQYLIENWFNEKYKNQHNCYKTPYEYIDKLNRDDFYIPNEFVCWTQY